MIGTKLFLVALISTLNFCNKEPPKGIPRVTHLVPHHRQHGHNPMAARVEIRVVDVYSRAAMAHDLEGYLAGLKAFPCCTPLRAKDFERCSNPSLPVNRSTVPLIGMAPGNLTEPHTQRPLPAPPLPCQPWERPNLISTAAAQQPTDPRAHFPGDSWASLRSLQKKPNTALIARQGDEGNPTEVLRTTKQPSCSSDGNVTAFQGQCSKNGTRSTGNGNNSRGPDRTPDNQPNGNGLAARMASFAKTKGHSQNIRHSAEEDKIQSGRELYIPLLGRKIPVPHATKDRKPTESGGIRLTRVPIEPFVPVYVARVEGRPAAYGSTANRPIAITFPDTHPTTASLSGDVVQAVLSFPLRSVLCMSMVVESALGFLILTCSSERRAKDGGESANEPRRVAMLEGHVVDSFPSEKMSSESCVVVSLSATNSDCQSLSEDEWELPLI